MLAPHLRRLYSDCFAAPQDYVFDCAAATTYSMDLESLLFAQFCLATGGSGEPEQALANPVALLEAIHRTSGRVTVFCHAGETNAPEQAHALYGLLENSIVPCRGRGGGALFHPKLWLLRFQARDGSSALLRAVVLSRNLTASRAWDLFVCVEGTPSKKTKDSRGLSDLLGALPELATQPLGAQRSEVLASLARDAERTSFEAPTPFEGPVRFEAFGTKARQGFRPSDAAERVLAISPWISNAVLRELGSMAKSCTLISRPEEMSRCDPAVLEAWDCYTLNDAASADATVADDEQRISTADAAPLGLHAKALVLESGRRATWWIGSANLTDPVRSGSSVELMVRLEGKKTRVGIDAFRDAGFEQLLEVYRHTPLPEDPQAGNRAAVEKTKAALIDAKLSLRCQSSGEHWDLLLHGALGLPDSVQVSARPITLSRARALRVEPGQAELAFKGLTMEALSALVCFELSAGLGDEAYHQSLTLKLPIGGLPDRRDARITRAIIRDRSAFLSYLRCMLATVGGLDLSTPLSSSRERGEPGEATRAGLEAGLLEQLLRALHHEPERLRGMRALFERAELEAAADSPIPDEFRALWQVFDEQLAALEAAREKATPP